MKIVTLLFTLLILAACNESTRIRPGKCRPGSSQITLCNNTEAIKAEVSTDAEFRKKYIAEVTTAISIDDRQLILKDQVLDSDHDQELSCDLDISSEKKFTYSIKNEQLILKDRTTTLVLDRSNGLGNDGLEGTWMMKEDSENVQTITELIFNNMDEIRIRKTCNLQ
jgi:hypothetical protein